MNLTVTEEKLSRSARMMIILFIGFSAIAAGLGAFSGTQPFRGLDLFFQDRFMAWNGSAMVSDAVVIVDIDEESLSAVGQWPWPRYRLARLIQTVNALGARTVGLDIILPEPDRTSLKNIRRQFRTDFDLPLEFTGAPASLDDNDAYLARIIRDCDVVGARYFYFDHFNKQAACNYQPFSITGLTERLSPAEATGILCNTFDIEKAYPQTGFINNRYDPDGLLRETPLLISFNQDIFIHFSLAVLLKTHHIRTAAVEKNRLGFYLKAGRFHIPVSENGYVYPRFTGPARTYAYVPAIQVMNGTCPGERIRDRIVLIGSSAVGLSDLHQTLFDSRFPGVETHAVILNDIMENRLVIRPVWTPALIAALCLLTGVLMGFFYLWSVSPALFFSGTSVWIGCLVFSSLAAFTAAGIMISPGVPAMLAAVQFTCITFVRFAAARRASFIWFRQLSASQQLTIESLVSLVETRDSETGLHIKRTQHYARALALHLKEAGRFPDILTDSYIRMLFLLVPLHDIGKVGIPDRILLKPGRLTPEEFEIMKLHASYGRDTIIRAAGKINGGNYLQMGAEIAGAHHEKWDGTGYPDGLEKEMIPLSGRIMSICDVYDALISKRCYKKPFSHEYAMTVIKNGRETVFDPVLVDAFFAIEDMIRSIAAKFRDDSEKSPSELKNIIMGKYIGKI